MQTVSAQVWLEGAVFGLQWGKTASAKLYVWEHGEGANKVALASMVTFEDEPTSDMLQVKCRYSLDGRTFSGVLQPKREERLVTGNVAQITMVPHAHEGLD